MPDLVEREMDIYRARKMCSGGESRKRDKSGIQARIGDPGDAILAPGLKPGDKVIVYCQGGIHAAYDYFTLKLTGFHPVLYVGSFGEWGNAFNAAVETGRGGAGRASFDC